MFVATDLHGHTFHSDGRATPDEYVEFRRALGMKAIAIADHDVLSGVRAGAVAAERAGMLFIPALEVTSHLAYGQSAEEQFHILAYYTYDVLEGCQLEQTALYRRGLVVPQQRPPEQQGVLPDPGDLRGPVHGRRQRHGT